MRREDEPDLIRTAEQIADGVPIDWDARLHETPALGRALGGMRSLESIVAAHRAQLEPAGGGVAPLFAWGPLQVLEKLGAGSYGEVYRAWDPALQREVALKLRRAPGPRDDASGARRWLEEARRLARVRHPNVVTVLGAEVNAGRPGLWTELLAGHTLEDTLRSRGPLGAHEAAALGVEICRGLAAVHAAGLVHGDLTSTNVMRVGDAGAVAGAGRIVLTDFGAAVERGGMTGTAVTPLACAPEVLRGGPPTEAADVYALGVLLYRLVTHAYPVEAESLDSLRRAHERGARPTLRDRRADLPGGFVAAVERALSPDPAARYASAGAMESALVAHADHAASRAPEPSSPIAQAAPRQTRRILIAASVAIAVALGWIIYRDRVAREPAPTEPVAITASPAGPTSDEATRPEPSAATPAQAPSLAPRVEAVLYRSTGAGVEPLANGGSIRPGQRLFLDLETREPLHAYVLDEDAEGRVFVLFPVAGLDLANPIPAGEARLPGARGGAPIDWQVTSAGGRETILIVAARSPLATLEAAVADVPRAAEGRPVSYAELDAEALRRLRGVGGLAPGVPTEHGGALAELARTLARRVQQKGDLWIRQITLENPVP